MADIICRNCREPWEDYYLRWDAPYERVEANEPADVVAEHDRFLAASDADETVKIGHGEFANFFPLFDAVLRGRGCPSCWGNPENVIQRTTDTDIALLSANLDAYDGDPMDILNAYL